LRLSRIALLLALALPTFLCAEDGETYVLLVGVGAYRANSGLNNLKYAESDMSALADTFKSIGVKAHNIRLMLQSAIGDDRFKPRRKNILDELKLLLDDKAKDDSVVIVFAGHGVQYRDKEDTVYFCPSDALLTDPETWLDLKTVFEQLKKCEAGSKVLISDCCRDDPRIGTRRGAPEGVESVTRVPKLRPPSSVALMFSCGNGEFAHEDDELKGGVFTHYLIEGIRQKAAQGGCVEIAPLAKTLRKSVYDYVSGKHGEAQHPVLLLEENQPLTLGKAKLAQPGQIDAIDLAARPKEITLDLGEGVKMELVYVTPGEFFMGEERESPFDEMELPGAISGNNTPDHLVQMKQGYYIGKYAVTVRQFKRFAADFNYQTIAEKAGKGRFDTHQTCRFVDGRSWRNPGFEQTDDHPVVQIAKDDAQGFALWLTAKSGKPIRLPTEEEWEYAARGPKSLIWPWDNLWFGEKANHADQTLLKTDKEPKQWDCSDETDGYAYTSAVGAMKVPSWCGAYDMSGNVMQWCKNEFYVYYKTVEDKVDAGTRHIVRGGSWKSSAKGCKCSKRVLKGAADSDNDMGFRIMLEVLEKN